MGPISAIACDYDRTLTDEGLLPDARAAGSLASWRARTGGAVLVVSGRDLPFLQAAVPWADAIVAENGAIVHWPAPARTERVQPGDVPALAALLGQRGIPLDRRERILALATSHVAEVRRLIASERLAVDLVVNVDSLMALPHGVHKGTGVAAACRGLRIPLDGLAAIGDGENDDRLLEAAALRIAVANAVPAVKRVAHVVTHAANGAGVVEAIERHLSRPSGKAP